MGTNESVEEYLAMMENQPFLVLVQHSQGDQHLYSLLALDEQSAEREVMREFRQEYMPDELGDWTTVVLQPTFERRAVHVARLDNGL